jgi:hypothetical protein
MNRKQKDIIDEALKICIGQIVDEHVDEITGITFIPTSELGQYRIEYTSEATTMKGDVEVDYMAEDYDYFDLDEIGKAMIEIAEKRINENL